MILYWHSGNQNIEWVIVVVTPSDQIIMMSSLNKTVTHKVRFWCYFTETTVHRTRVWSRTHYTDSQVNQSVLFLYLILRAKQTFFVCLYLYCHCRSNYQAGRGWWSHSSVYCRYIFGPVQARNWISIDICCVLFF